MNYNISPGGDQVILVDFLTETPLGATADVTTLHESFYCMSYILWLCIFKNIYTYIIYSLSSTYHHCLKIHIYSLSSFTSIDLHIQIHSFIFPITVHISILRAFPPKMMAPPVPGRWRRQLSLPWVPEASLWVIGIDMYTYVGHLYVYR